MKIRVNDGLLGLVEEKKWIKILFWESFLIVSGECLYCLLVLLLIVWLNVNWNLNHKGGCWTWAERKELNLKFWKPDEGGQSEFSLLLWVFNNVVRLISNRYYCSIGVCSAWWEEVEI